MLEPKRVSGGQGLDGWVGRARGVECSDTVLCAGILVTAWHGIAKPMERATPRGTLMQTTDFGR